MLTSLAPNQEDLVLNEQPRYKKIYDFIWNQIKPDFSSQVIASIFCKASRAFLSLWTSHCFDNLFRHAEKHFLNSKDILIVDDMNQLCERTAASSDDMKKSVIWMQRRVKHHFILHLQFFCKFYFRNFTKSFTKRK